MDSRKSRGRNKIFKCFRPVSVDENGLPSPTTEDCFVKPVLTYIEVADNGKDSSRRRFSRAIKAVLFDTSLAKTIRDKKYRKKPSRTNRSVSVKNEKSANFMKDNDKTNFSRESSDGDESLATDSSRSYLFSLSNSTTAASSLSSSCSSSMNSNSRSMLNSMERKVSFQVNPLERKGSFQANLSELSQKRNSTKRIGGFGFNNSTIGLCLLLISFSALIFCGRICAIFCTSIWLFFGRRWINSVDSPVKLAVSPDLDSENYKKRIIMEGLLNRNRNR